MPNLLSADVGFRRLWIGDVLSKVGAQIPLVAIPVLAATELGASTWQVALLATAGYLPLLLIGLPVGVWADRVRRRRSVLIAADLGRAAALCSVPLAAWRSVLTIEQLYVVEFVVGVGAVIFDVFLGAYVVTLVGRDRLVAANGRLEVNRTIGFSAGPAIAGQLVQWVGAAFATIGTALGFLWSAVWLARIRPIRVTAFRARSGRASRGHPPGSDQTPSAGVLGDVGAGLRYVWQEPFTRMTTLYGTAAVLFLSARYSVETLFLLRTVGLSPATIGVLFSVAGLAAVAGAAVAPRLARWLGEIQTIAVSGCAVGVSNLLIPTANRGLGLLLFTLGAGFSALWITVSNVVSVSLRQRRCPDHLLGRMGATTRFLSWAFLPFGGVIGGALGTLLGLRTALWVTAAGLTVAAAVQLRYLARLSGAEHRTDETVKISDPARR